MRMKTFTKAVALFVVMALMMVMTISAATVTDVDVSIDYSTGSVVITAMHPDGAAGAGKTVNVVVTGATDVYWNDGVADETGKVTFTFTMDPTTDLSGTYVVDMGGAGLELKAAGDSFTYVNTSDAATFIATVDPKGAADLQTYLEGIGHTDDFDGDANYATQFDVNCASGSDYYGLTPAMKTAIATLLAGVDYYADGVYNQADYYAFLTKFNQAVTIALLNDGVATDVVAKYDDVFGFDTSSTSWYAKLTPAQYPVVESALLNKNFGVDNGAAVLDAFNRATALALYNDMNQSTKGNLVDYITYTNAQGYTNSTIMSLARYNALATDTYKDMVRDAMADGTFTSFTDVQTIYTNALAAAETAYAEALANANPGGGATGPSTTITVTPVAPVEPEKDLFNDLGSVDWAKEAINALAKDGIVNGVAEGKFAPNDVLTREQFVKILVGALDIKANGNTPFTDVVASEWYANYVAIAYNSGIVNGTSATEFGVGDSLTREQLCTMVYRAIKSLGIELEMVNSTAAFVDGAEISDWAKEAVDYLYKAGVVNGVGGNAFDPQGTTTRAMGAKVIYGVLEGGVK